jgi:hypothetical protein
MWSYLLPINWCKATGRKTATTNAKANAGFFALLRMTTEEEATTRE